jgi:SAM-dependent methyltransferase
VPIDFAPTALDYASYRPEYPEELFGRLASMGIARPGQCVVDLGTGTGALARGLARCGCRVTGVDVAGALLDQARRLDAPAGLQIDYRVGRAEQTGLPGGGWDVVTAGQCWHWFDRDQAATEARRLLGSAGCLVICHHDYLAQPGNLCAATEALILQFNPEWMMAGSTGIYPAWTQDAGRAGFVRLETFSFDHTIGFTHEAWRGRMRTCNAIGPSLQPQQIADFDQALAQLLCERFPAEPLWVPHRVWAMVAWVPDQGQPRPASG